MKAKKGDICPICKNKILGKNVWVMYHIRYNPPLVILACKFCNFTEFCLRNGIKGTNALTIKRVNKVINYQKKFNIKI